MRGLGAVDRGALIGLLPGRGLGLDLDLGPETRPDPREKLGTLQDGKLQRKVDFDGTLDVDDLSYTSGSTSRK